MYTSILQKTIFDLVGFQYDKEIYTYPAEALQVTYDGKIAKIGYNSISALTRGYFLFAKNFNSEPFEIIQNARFKTCGCMLDVSRNGVMKVSAVKKYLEYMAALGINMLMLYTEDTYSIEEYPYFGHMRGRYSVEELKEIDQYAAFLGIEVIPCIQTLSHLGQFLKYAPELSDTAETLLTQSKETYDFIDAEIKTMRSAFQTNRIHIGMDEAIDVGLGNFLKKNGYHKSYEIIINHLNEVTKICEKYKFKPLMWNDMFFCAANKTHDYYTEENIDFPKGITEKMPQVDSVYWDYFCTNENRYIAMLKNTAKLSRNPVFAGAIILWQGMLPCGKETVESTKCAMKACLKTNTEEVFATMWGDDGTETNAFYSIPYLPLYSEYCYLGENCMDSDIESTSEFLTKIPFETTLTIGSIHQTDYEDCEISGKTFFYTDIFYGMGIKDEQFCTDANKSFTQVHNMLLDSKFETPMLIHSYQYAEMVYEIITLKSKICCNLRKAYKENNINYIKILTEKTLPELRMKYIRLKEIHKEQWNSVYKPFGFEVLSFRYGGIVSRIDDFIETLSLYLNKEIPSIPELEEEILPLKHKCYHTRHLVTPSSVF